MQSDLSRPSIWLRLLWMVIFAVIFNIAELIVAAIAVLQFGIVLFTGECNARILAFSRSLNRFIYQILSFVTFDSDERPFPFADWPATDPSA